MEQIEVISWKSLDAIKQAAHIVETVGDLDTNEQMAVFCSIEEDFFELYYSELESNYIRHFEDEDEMFKFLDLRKNEFGEEDYDTVDYYDDDEDSFEDAEDEEYGDYKIREDEEEEDY